MPDSKSAPSALPRYAGVVAAALGGAALIAAAFLTWFSATADLPALPGLPAQVKAEVTGLGEVSAPAVGGVDVASQVPTDGAWVGAAVIAAGAVAIVLGAVAALARPATVRRSAAGLVAAAGLAGIGVAGYALMRLVGSRTVPVQGVSLELDVAAGPGPFVAIAGGAAVGVAAVLLLLARRAAPAPPTPAAVRHEQRPVPSAPVPPPLPQRIPAPNARWARPAPSPRLPSQQDTVVVKRPPRPVRVSPNPVTEAIPRQNSYDGPTGPL